MLGAAIELDINGTPARDVISGNEFYFMSNIRIEAYNHVPDVLLRVER